MIFKNQISQILTINNKVNDSTIRFDKGSPSPNIFLSSHQKELSQMMAIVTKHPTAYYEPLITEIIKIEKKTSDWKLQKENIALTNGVLSGLFSVLGLISNQGNKVIINDLCFEGTSTLLDAIRLIPVRVDFNNKYALNKTILKSKAKVLILNSPENPSGKIYDQDFLVYLGFLAKKYNLLIISDEVNNQKVYTPYKFIPPCQFIPKSNLIVLNSFTKNYFLPGIRLGWIAAKPETIKKINNLNTVSQVTINYPSQMIAYFVLKNYQREIEGYKEILFDKKLFMEKELVENNFIYMNPVMAGSVVFVKINQDGRNLSEVLLKKYNIGTIPGILFGKKWNQWLRLGFGAVSKEEIAKGLKIISKMRSSSR